MNSVLDAVSVCANVCSSCVLLLIPMHRRRRGGNHKEQLLPQACPGRCPWSRSPLPLDLELVWSPKTGPHANTPSVPAWQAAQTGALMPTHGQGSQSDALPGRMDSIRYWQRRETRPHNVKIPFTIARQAYLQGIRPLVCGLLHAYLNESRAARGPIGRHRSGRCESRSSGTSLARHRAAQCE